MKQYKVKALSVGGLRNKIFFAGDTVNEDHFPPGTSESLVEQGFLVPDGEIEGTEELKAPNELEKKIDTETKTDKNKKIK